MIAQDIEAGRGVGDLGPHGDLAEELLDYVARWRIDHVCYFDPADLDHPVGLNLLENVPPHHRHLVASDVVAAFKSSSTPACGPLCSAPAGR